MNTKYVYPLLIITLLGNRKMTINLDSQKPKTSRQWMWSMSMSFGFYSDEELELVMAVLKSNDLVISDLRGVPCVNTPCFGFMLVGSDKQFRFNQDCPKRGIERWQHEMQNVGITADQITKNIAWLRQQDMVLHSS